MSTDKNKYKARLGYWYRQFNKREKLLKQKYDRLAFLRRKTFVDELNFARKIDDLQMRLVASQDELLRTSSQFLMTLSKTQCNSRNVINQLIEQKKEISHESFELKRKLVEKDNHIKSLEEKLQQVGRAVPKAGEEYHLVKQCIDPENVPVKKILSVFRPLEPLRLDRYIKYINTFVESAADLSVFDNKLAEDVANGNDGLLEDKEIDSDDSGKSYRSDDDNSEEFDDNENSDDCDDYDDYYDDD